MAICILSIHKFARKLGAELSLSALVLCGVSALIINFMAIRVNPFLTKAYYYILGTMIIFAATGTTCYNKYLLYRRSKLAGQGAVHNANITVETDIVPDIAEEMPETASAAETKAMPDATSAKLPEPKLAEVPQEVFDEPTPINKLDETPAMNSDKIAESTPAEELNTIAESTPAKELEAITEPAPVEKFETIAEPEPANTIKPVLPGGLDSMDALLDFAFDQNAAGNHQMALLAYSTALQQYNTDSYAPFILIEMVNLYKSQEQYQAAIDCIHNYMDIPAIQENPAYQEKFQAYLAEIKLISHSVASAQSSKD